MVALIGVSVKMRPERALQPLNTAVATLGGEIRHLLAQVAAIAEEQGVQAWLVGGIIRDLLLGLTPGRDVDVAVEGDAMALAHRLMVALGGQLLAAHEAFGTATVRLASGSGGGEITLDLAQTRTERYPHPAMLPEVQPASLGVDLWRRDFSLNAMAMRLVVDGQGELTCGDWRDPCGGYADLKQGVLRVLHATSFDDDPTRILRGLRLAARLDLQLDSFTREALTGALQRGRLEQTGVDRLRNELCLVLDEPRPDEVVRLADAWEVTPKLIAGLHWSEALARRCGIAAFEIGHLPLLFAALLVYDLDEPARATLTARYRLPKDAAQVLHEVDIVQAALPQVALAQRNSELEQLLRPLSETTLRAALIAESGAVSVAIRRYLDQLRHCAPQLNGHDLQRLGVRPGPELGRLLRELRVACLNGLVQTREDEERWVIYNLGRQA